MNNLNTFLDKVAEIFTQISQSLYGLINKIFEEQMLSHLWQIAKGFGHIVIGVLEALLGVLKSIIK